MDAQEELAFLRSVAASQLQTIKTLTLGCEKYGLTETTPIVRHLAAQDDEIERLRAELAEAKRDVDRINWMEKNKVGIYAAQSSVRATTGPRYFKPWKFCGWSAANRDDELPTVREAIDAAMAGGEK